MCSAVEKTTVGHCGGSQPHKILQNIRQYLSQDLKSVAVFMDVMGGAERYCGAATSSMRLLKLL
jgi:hypothetical protein